MSERSELVERLTPDQLRELADECPLCWTAAPSGIAVGEIKPCGECWPCKYRNRLRLAAAEIERLEGALREIAERRTWAGVWRIGCECERRLPEIFDIADAALARKEADRG